MIYSDDAGVTKVNAAGGSGKVPTGALQFRNDWPGLWLRGDDAIDLLMNLREYEAEIKEKGVKYLHKDLKEIMKIIEENVVKK